MNKSFDATVQIVTSKLSNSTNSVNKEGGQHVAAYIHEIYKELDAIERSESEPGDSMPSIPVITG